MNRQKKISDIELLTKKGEGLTGVQLAAYFNCSTAAISKRLKRLNPATPAVIVPKAIDALTPKQAQVVKRIARGESGTNAVSQSFDTTTRNSAREIARKLLNMPQVQLALSEELERAGLSRSYRVTKLREAVDHPDPSTSLKALSLAFNLADEMPAVKNKSLVVTATACPVDLSAYSM